MQIARLDLAFSALILGVGIWVLVQAADYGITSDTGPGSGTFPLVAGALISVFSAITLVRALRKRGAQAEADDERINVAEIARIMAILALIWLYIVALEWLGAFLPLPVLMIAISLVIHWRTDPRWLATLVGIAVSFSVACYFIFKVFLRVLLPEGPFGF
jgi:hypothetical protein